MEDYDIHLKPCSCSEKYNLPVFIPCYDGCKAYVVCDFCGNSTKKHNTDEAAVFKRNAFQASKGRRNKCC